MCPLYSVASRQSWSSFTQQKSPPQSQKNYHLKVSYVRNSYLTKEINNAHLLLSRLHNKFIWRPHWVYFEDKGINNMTLSGCLPAHILITPTSRSILLTIIWNHLLCSFQLFSRAPTEIYILTFRQLQKKSSNPYKCYLTNLVAMQEI